MEEHTKINRDFAKTILPWLVLVGALGTYLVTLNRWVTTDSLIGLVRLNGWDWQPTVMAPLHFLLTWPIRWLPPGAQPAVLNGFAAVCAALALALLARSVALLPHDRTRDERVREKSDFSLLSLPAAWLPPTLAVLACGLQVIFWQNATAGTGEMLDLLLFAYLVRCLLEYRIGEHDGWLYKGALVYGLGLTNNYALIGFFPLFLAALIWIKGMEFFNVRFLLKMAGLLLAGLSLYLLLPLVAVLSGYDGASFWSLLKSNLYQQKTYIFFSGFRLPVFLLALTSIVPLAFIGVRWPSSLGDVSPVANLLTGFLFRVMVFAFLVGGLWLLYAPVYGQVLDRAQLKFLPFYYLTALCVGYFLGYLLLVFGEPGDRAWERPAPLLRLLNVAVVVLVWSGLVFIPVFFLQRNLPLVQAANRPVLRQYAGWLMAGLPANQSTIVLSDDPLRLYLLKAYLHQQPPAPYLLVHTPSLPFSGYQQYLTRQSPALWPALPASQLAREKVEQPLVNQQLLKVNQAHELYYLHPSFGHFFEDFYPVPHGLVLALKPYPPGLAPPPPLSEAVWQENRQFWDRVAREGFPQLRQLIQLKNTDAQTLGQYYARALNTWGAEVQRHRSPTDAAQYFAWAVALNPNNEVARINLEANGKLQTGKTETIAYRTTLWERFGIYRTVDAVLGANGAFDEPNYCFVLGLIFARNLQFRQAIQYFNRVKAFNPDNIEADIMLGNVMLEARLPQQALDIVQQARASGSRRWLDATNQAELVRMEVLANYLKKEEAVADQLLESTLQANPRNEAILLMATQVYMMRGRYTNALATTEQHLKINADNLAALLNQGALCIQLNRHADAVPPLTRLLDRQPDNHAARLNRAIAELQSGQLDHARMDYEKLLDLFPKVYAVHYGLAEVAYRQKEMRSAIRYYESYLKLAPEGSAEYKAVVERLKQLKRSAP